MSDELEDAVLSVSSGVSAFDGKPFVHVRWLEQSGQWDIESARQHALQVLEAAEAAEHDAAVVRWLRERVKVNDGGRVAEMLADLRRFRDEHR